MARSTGSSGCSRGKTVSSKYSAMAFDSNSETRSSTRSTGTFLCGDMARNQSGRLSGSMWRNSKSTFFSRSTIADPLLVVRSLARPGGNLTGFSSLLIDLPSKQAELVKEMVPGLTRVGSISNMSNAAARAIWKEFQEATAVAGIEAHLLDVRTPSDIVSAFDGARKQRINAVLVMIDTLTQTNQHLIIELTTKHQLPAIFMSREFVDAGGLMSYGVHYPDLYRRAATLVHKIFNGAKPADLPVEQPTRFEFVINLRTAKALGLNVPDKLLAIADEVIE